MLLKHISLFVALFFAFALVGASPAPSKRAPAPYPAPSKRAPAPYPAPSKRAPAPSKRAPAPYPAPSKRAPAPAPHVSKRAPAPAPSKRAPAPVPAPSKRAFVPESEPEMITTEADYSESTSPILACEELNHPSDASTSEFLSIFDIVLTEVERAMWVGLDCERVVNGDLVKRDAINLVTCVGLTEDGLIATGCTRI